MDWGAGSFRSCSAAFVDKGRHHSVIGTLLLLLNVKIPRCMVGHVVMSIQFILPKAQRAPNEDEAQQLEEEVKQVKLDVQDAIKQAGCLCAVHL